MKHLFALLLFAFAAYGQQQGRVAIINTLDNQDSINFSDLSYLTNRLRETAVNVLPKELYGVMTTESIVAFLGEENAIRVCNEASCLAEIGRKVNADYVAQARIGRFSGELTINFELYDSRSGNLVGSFTGSSPYIKGFLAIIDENAPVLFKKLPGIKKKKDPPIPVFNPALIPEPVPAPEAIPAPVVVPEPIEVVTEPIVQCERIYNINEIIFKVKNVFINQLKACPSKLAKEMETPTLGVSLDLLTKEVFIDRCVEGMRYEIPGGFPGSAQLFGSLKNFVQSALNSAYSADGGVDPKKFPGIVDGMNIKGLLSEVRRLANDECVVDEPYDPSVEPHEPSVAPVSNLAWSFGIRAGFNFSHVYAEYRVKSFAEVKGSYQDVVGMQLGFVLDIPMKEWFLIQPGIMYIQKGMRDDRYEGSNDDIAAHYFEIPNASVTLYAQWTQTTNVVYGPSVNYGGETYKTVVIGSQTWFQRNLNYAVEGGKCYNNNEANCDTYGRLYNWATAMNLPASCYSNSCSEQIQPNHKGICPEGWHIPSNDEWGKLVEAVGGSSVAGKKLKAENGWDSNGTNEFGFSALPGGDGYSDGSFYYVGYYGLWWSASEDYSSNAYGRGMGYDYEGVYYLNNLKSYLYSVRCLQD